MVTPRNWTTTYQTEPLGRQAILDKIYIGFVRDNRDSLRMGRLQVWIPELSPNIDNETAWFTVNYASPFAGATPITDVQQGSNKFADVQKSYGFWFIPPDVDNEVLVAFANSDPNKGFWFACLFQQNMNHMIPGIASNTSFGQKNPTQPVSEYNKKNDINLSNPTRPSYDPLSFGLIVQGLFGDFTRGQTSSSARRETPSRTQGFITPRGHHLVFDDGFKEDQLGDNTFNSETNPAHQFDDEARFVDQRQDEFIRFRTRSGAQILISETDGFVYFISRDGKNWVELDNQGHVDVFGFEEVSIRSNSDVNIHADKDVNIEAGRNVNVKASGQHGKTGKKVQDGQGTGGNLNFESIRNTKFISGIDYDIHAVNNFDLLSGGKARITIDKDINLRSVNGNILETANKIHLNGPEAEPAEKQTSIVTNLATDKDALSATLTIWPVNQRETIVTRMPSHEPFPGHENRTTGLNGRVQESVSFSSEEKETINNNSSTKPGDSAESVDTPSGKKEKIGETRQGTPVYKTSESNKEFKNPENMSVGEKGLEIIKNSEGFESRVYKDSAGNKTVGYGHKLTEKEKKTGKINVDGESIDISSGISKKVGEKLLEQDIQSTINSVKDMVKSKLTQSQFDAITSFAFNVGSGNLKKSTLLEKINSGNFEEVPGEFAKWNKAGGKVLKGLVKRRDEEAKLFTS